MNYYGNLYGTALVQRSGKIGGSKDVFVKLQNAGKDEYAWPTFGGQIKNPFKGVAKLFAGDLAEFRADEKGVKPAYYILKTYLVKAQSGTTVKIARDGYKHVPFAGDVLMKAPAVIGGAGVAATVSAVALDTLDGEDVWVLTMSATLALAAGDVLVEAEANPATTGATDTHKMVVERINSVCPCDYDFMHPNVADPNAADPDFENARYYVTLALGGLMYAHKMSPMPQCVLDLNQINVNGWYGFDFRNLQAAGLASLKARVAALED